MATPRILVVDDEPSLRNALSRWFDARGFHVEVASDGVEAVELFAKHTFDVVTMDLDMPKMNGIEATRRIRAANPDVPIIVLTGLNRTSLDTCSCGASRVCVKPMRLCDLENEVRSLLPLD